MDYIRFAISNPVKVSVGVILTLLFGLLALFAIPIQLTPDVDQPVISVATRWTGRSPEEVEKEVVEEQEEKLKSISNLKKMTSVSRQGEAEITLEFYIGTNLDRARQDVSDKLREVPEYPADVDEPVITASDAADASAVAWIVLTSDDPGFDVEGFYDIADKRIKPELERVSGVSSVNIFGGRRREVHIQVNPKLLAQRGITFNQLRNALRLENVNVSAGDIPDGRLDARVRTVGQYDNLDDIRQTVVAYSDGVPVRVQDLADVVLTLEKRRTFVRSLGQPALAFPVTREVGANVMAVMQEVRQRIDDLNKNVLPALGPVKLTQVYDETVYIDDAIQLVYNDLFVGGSLSVLVLLLFLRIVRPTVVIALAIPISIVGTFVVMAALGRNINVISLAGLSFAVGMVVDDAIVVLENIDRHLSMGKTPARAAYDATKEVWGAILAATLTIMAVFLPVIFMEEEAGQLFRDIAIAICASVGLSLIVSVTVVPSASARWLRQRRDRKSVASRTLFGLFGIARVFEGLTRGLADMLYWLSPPTALGVAARLLIVAAFTLASIVGAVMLMPPTTYLPVGNSNLVFGMMLTPPGYNLAQNASIGDRVESIIRPYWEARTQADLAGLPPVLDPFTRQPLVNVPPMENFFFVAARGALFMGASSKEKQNVQPLGPLMSSAMFAVPGAYGGARQRSIFGRGISGTNAIDVEVSATDLDELRRAAEQLNQRLLAQYGPANVQPDPVNFTLAGPELQVRIDQVRKDMGVDVAALGLGVQALVDGAVIGDYRLGGETIDLLLTRDPQFPLSVDTLGQVPIAINNSNGPSAADSAGIVPLSTVADIKRATSPQQINRIEQLRSVKITVQVPADMPLEAASNDIQAMVQSMRDGRLLPPTVQTRLAGTADKLIQVRSAMLGDWHGSFGRVTWSLINSRMFLALLVTYLLMAALFESFLYPFVIMFSVPLAAVGGFMGLAIAHAYDPTQFLDVVTMLGFVILIGIVVRNAILIVHQALNFMRGLGESEADVRDPLPPRKAIVESVRTRIRPIFMTALTSVFGMMPLVLMPGAGSELYRGLGSVVVGGLIVSTVFTLIVVPLLLSLVIDMRTQITRWLSSADEPQSPPPVPHVQRDPATVR